jgi:long-subunit fatty acid transport protein
MKKLSTALGAAGAIAASSGMAGAGAIDRSMQSIAMLFETGNYVELTYGYLWPDVKGTEVTVPGNPVFNGSSSDNMYGNYSTGSLSFKTAINENIDLGFIIDKPYGADTQYPLGTGYFAAGTTANLDTTAYTALLKYRFPSNVSLIGGLRYQTLAADAFIPFLTPRPGVTPPYSVVGDESGGWGYVLGVAWEKPEIAARVSLTYNSAISYDLPTTEKSVLGTTASTTDTELPQSVNIEFQTGVAPDTLLFGGIRWVDWTEFVVAPPQYSRLTGGQDLIFYNGDVYTYTLGVGYRFNEAWSGAVTYVHDDPIGGYSLNLGPVDGYDSIALAATWTNGAIKVTGALRYFELGDTQTQAGALSPAANFDGNSAIGVGLRVGYTF